MNDHFLVGEAILVRAVTSAGLSQIDLFLPKGDWFDYWDMKAAPIGGGEVSRVPLKPDYIPVYVRGGHILMKKMRRRRSASAMDWDPYTMFVYGNKAEGRLYVDDGHSHSFQHGAFLYQEFKFDGKVLREIPARGTLSIGAAGGLPQVPERHRQVERIILIGLPTPPRSTVFEQKPGVVVEVTSEQAKDGLWIATVKKPPCTIGSSWSMELKF